MAGPTYEEKRQIFERHFLLGKMSTGEVDTLLAYSRVERYPATTEIYAKGSPGNCMMLVLRGTAKMSSVSAEGKEIVLNIMNPGDLFGEIALLDGSARSADAIANTACELFTIDRREFIPFVRSQPGLAMKFIELLCTRIRWTSDQVEQVILQNLPGRLASALLRLTEKHKLEPQGRTIAITQQEISEMVGMSRESINKQLRAWAARDWVRLEHGVIVVLKAEPLQILADAGSGDEGE